MIVVKPPKNIDEYDLKDSLFLAGSIEMGKAEDWQKMIEDELSDYDITILNPRRDDWDSSWEQSIRNPHFVTQVEWELNALERATIILFYFQPDTISPISLLELGLHAKTNNVIVCCPDGYHRKGNVEITCDKYDILLTHTLLDLIEKIKLIFIHKKK